MNRTALLALVAVALGAAAWWFAAGRTDMKTTLAGADRNFAVKDTNSIARIFLVDRNNNKTDLRREGDHWTYNGQYRAAKGPMKNILDAIARLEIQYKPANAAVSNMVQNIATEGIKVELYDKEGKLIKAYYVGGATPDERGTYIMLDGFNQPYVGGIRNWTGNVRFRYNLLGDDWRDRHIFEEEVEEIQSVTVEYPQQRNKSFRLRRQGAGFEVTPYYSITPRINKPVAQGRIEQYLVGFDNIQAGRYINRQPERDSIQRMTPFSIITVKRANGDSTSIVLHPMYVDPAVDTKTGKIVYAEYVPGYYVTSLPKGDFLSIQHDVISKLFWDYSYFFD